MRIALTADPELPVPPIQYGGIERIVDMVARGLVARGHDVTVFAHPGSQTAGRLVPWHARTSGSRVETLRNAGTLLHYIFSERFDLVHSFSRVAYLTPILPLPIPKLMTYQREIGRRSVRLGHALSRGTLWFSAVSRFLLAGVAGLGNWRLVFNGVPLDRYIFCRDPGDNAPLVFLGRIESIKGPHLAIEVAHRTGRPLIIAGNVPKDDKGFFDAKIRPQLDGVRVTYAGPVNDHQKNALLGSARALLMPIVWEEPFGIVMAEAMACGTPVIGLGRGALPEIVDDGVTGYVAKDVDGLVAAVGQVAKIRRADCRTRVERLFSDRAVVAGYEAVYHEMLDVRSRKEAR